MSGLATGSGPASSRARERPARITESETTAAKDAPPAGAVADLGGLEAGWAARACA